MITIVVTGGIGVLILGLSLPFLLAPLRASRSGTRDIEILGGLSRYLIWTPYESLVLHRNGRVKAVVGTDGSGGSLFAFPLLGDSVYARLNLALRSFAWEEEVLTREALPCKIKLAVWWRVGDMDAFIAGSGTSKQLSQDDSRESFLTVAESRLLTLTESTTRAILAQASFLEVLTTVKPMYLDVHHSTQEPPPGLAELSSDLARRLSEVLRKEATAYGISIDRIEVQNIRFAREVEKELREVWLSYLKPVRAEQEAEADRITGMKKLDLLSREVDLLGGVAISTREIVKHLPENSNLTLEELITSVVSAARLSKAQDGIPRESLAELRQSSAAQLPGLSLDASDKV